VNAPLIAELIRLRYKLLWANTRSRNGRIALFLVAYLLLAMLLALLTTGGFAAAMVAVRAGRAEQVAQGALFALFAQAVIAANVVGFGMNAIFSDAELRRYPLAALDRRVARHVIGIVDPFWFLYLALELGLAIGLYAMGAGGFWLGTIAVLLLFVCNYLAARVVGLFIDRIVKRKGGSGILLGLILALVLVISLAGPAIRDHPTVLPAVTERLQFTPPFAAAAALVGSASALATLAVWIFGLGLILAWLENRPPQRQSAESTAISWDSPWDRIAALFGPSMGPFVGHWLRFYGRNSRTRVQLVIALVIGGFLTYAPARQLGLGPNSFFIAALGAMPFTIFMGTSRIAVNQFGYTGGAFRRYFLLPVDPGATLRAASYASLTLSAPLLPLALILWSIAWSMTWSASAPHPFDLRMLVMLACSSVTGLLVFNALGVWVTLFNPRRGNYNASFGNDLSLGGNILVIGGVVGGLWLPRLFHQVWPAAVSPESWWMLLPLPLLAAAFYAATLKAAGPVFIARREKLLAIVEGR
jgi:hypothetical protein